MTKILLAAVLALSASAEVLNWQDVEFYDRNIESGKVKKMDGMFHLDRDTGVIAFTSDNRVYNTIPSSRVDRIVYNDKDDRKLTITYRDARDRNRTAEFKLKGGNRENILSALASETNGRLERVAKK